MAGSVIVSRRGFLAVCLTVPAAAVLPLRRTCSPSPDVATSSGDHPTPRPGIDASRVPKASELQDAKRAIAAFDEVREIPHIIDGIRCHCGCADRLYSLLACYEGEHPMAMHCQVCQGEGRLAYRLHRAGKTLDEIRAAIDDRYG